MTMRWYPSGATPRGVPVSRRALPRRPVVLFLLVIVALGETGCQSSPCGGCGGGCGPVATTLRGIRETVAYPFRRLSGRTTSNSACCGSEVGTEVAPMPLGTPTIVRPAPSGTTVVPGASETVPPALEAIPSAGPGAPPTSTESTPSQGVKSGNGKASYEASRPGFGDETSPSDSLARSLNTSPAPTNRSAQGSSPSSTNEASPLDNLPPLDLPSEVARADAATATPPPPPAAEHERKPTATPEPVQEPATGLLGGLPAPAPAPAGIPGFRHFAGVESKLAGGSLPSAVGLDWLVERGYKTILDLREGNDISAAFIADADRRGLRYVALPINVKTVDSLHVSRFESEIALADGRPLYFCDTDGTRPGVMWYIHRMTVDKVDAAVARRDAEELGLSDKAFWAAAQAYLDGPKPQPVAVPPASPVKPAPAPAAATPPAPAAAPAPTPPSNAGAVPKSTDAAGTAAPPAAPAPAHAGDAAPTPTPTPHDPDAWKPLMALLVTGLGVPLAYVSRAALPTTFRLRSRASLPAPPPSPRSLPAASGG